MDTVTTEELINYKILPFNLYSEFGEKIFSAGENLTPGKLLQLKHLNIIYRDAADKNLDILPDDEEDPLAEYKAKLQAEKDGDSAKFENYKKAQEAEENANVEKKSSLEEVDANDIDGLFEAYEQNAKKREKVVEVFDMNPNQILKSNTIVDEIDIMNYKGPINKKSKIEPQNQIKLKAFYYETISNFTRRSNAETANLFLNIRDKILQDIIYRNESIVYSSQVKLIGEYNKCHALNVAIISGMLALKLDYSEAMISDIVLAGLLHDIGKTRVNPDLLGKTNLTGQEQKEMQLHTTIGYRILKEELEMPENIAIVALEHHENNDGSGYPTGKSGDLISKESQLVHIANHFDNLSFNRTSHLIKNTKEAVRELLKLGSRYFAPEDLYTFAHMFSYNDTVNFEDMVL